jgi:mannose-6-phosphate isomerase-like protein (cupin superfamily)
MLEVIDLDHKLSLFSDPWHPRTIAALNDHHVKLARLDGEFVWHRHAAEDELFLVLKGSLTIRLRDQDLSLEPGQLVVIPRGVEHMPVAVGEVHVLLLEPANTINTGDAPGQRTAPAEWI